MLDGEDDAGRQLGRVAEAGVGVDQLARFDVVGLAGPGAMPAFGPAPGAAAPGLGPADEHHVGPAGLDVDGRPGHQHLGQLASRSRVQVWRGVAPIRSATSRAGSR
ncbi:MAG: hypothetical protein ACRD0A_16945 [Acidimicrobiales bacterium]